MSKKLRFIIWLLVVGLILAGCGSKGRYGPINMAQYTQPIRVACVGDSITYGAGIKDRLHKSYPVQLGQMLGPRWDVRNFGISGTTMLKHGDKPYWKTQAYRDALAFNPDVVTIMLGTNDSKPQNWDKYSNEYEDDYEDMIAAFSSLPAKPRIWVCLPVPVFRDRWGIRESVVKDEIIPLVQRVAGEKKLPVIDLYKAMSGKGDMFPDGIHPDATGSREMARAVYKILTGREYD